MGKTSTHALQEHVSCWIARVGDAAYFLGHEIAAIDCHGPLTEEEIAEEVPSHVAATVPSGGSQNSDPDSFDLEVSPISDTSRMRRIKLDGK